MRVKWCVTSILRMFVNPSKILANVQMNFTVSASFSALNFFDILQTQGKYQRVSCHTRSLTPFALTLDPRPTDQPPFPFVGGAEFAGRISKDSPIPPGCPFKPGDRVFGSGQGAYAEKIATNWKQLFPIPKGINYNEAAGLFVTWPTSYEALVGRAELKAGERTVLRPRERSIEIFTSFGGAGEWCLVHAGAGGVGLAAIQIAKGWKSHSSTIGVTL